MGEDVDEPTQSASVAEAETRSAYAWGLADMPDEPEPQRLTPRRITTAAVAASLALTAIAGVIAWQHLGGEEPMQVAETASMVPAAVTPLTTTPKPVAAPPKPPPPPPPVTVTTVVIQTPAPTPVYVPPVVDMAALDSQFIRNMLAQGWQIWDTRQSVETAHLACSMLRNGATTEAVATRLANASQASMDEGRAFTATAMRTYPQCP